jgi:hypothetical protein
MTVTYHITDLLIELYRVFNLFNARFFESKLELPVIIVQSSRKRNTLGTCSVNKIWLRKATEDVPEKYEITISAEHLNRPIEDICATLLHEMIHLHNGLNNIQDTSNNFVYHNKKFKEQAEKRGLVIEHAKTIGWSVTTLQPATKEFIKSLNINEKVFEYYRKGAVILPKIKVDILTKEEKLNRLYQRIERLKEKIQKLEAEG